VLAARERRPAEDAADGLLAREDGQRTVTVRRRGLWWWINEARRQRTSHLQQLPGAAVAGGSGNVEDVGPVLLPPAAGPEPQHSVRYQSTSCVRLHAAVPLTAWLASFDG